jgi:hypothetical protein
MRKLRPGSNLSHEPYRLRQERTRHLSWSLRASQRYPGGRARGQRQRVGRMLCTG